MVPDTIEEETNLKNILNSKNQGSGDTNNQITRKKLTSEVISHFSQLLN